MSTFSIFASSPNKSPYVVISGFESPAQEISGHENIYQHCCEGEMDRDYSSSSCQKRSAILSMIGWTYSLINFFSKSGNLSYLQGNSWISQGSRFWMVLRLSSEHQIDITLLFCTLVLSLEGSLEIWRFSCVKLISSSAGLRKRATSSAYSEILCCIISPGVPLRESR